MKKLTLCFFFLALALGLSAQTGDAEARKAADAAIALYQLDETQAAEMYVIQERRFRNLASIEALRQTDYKFYLQKKNSIREGMMASVQRLLRANQMEPFNQALISRRQQESALKQKLKQEGATREEIQIAIWELE